MTSLQAVPTGTAGDYLTVTEIAKHLRVSKMTVTRLVNSGDIPAVRIGRQLRISRAALETYLQSSAA